MRIAGSVDPRSPFTVQMSAQKGGMGFQPMDLRADAETIEKFHRQKYARSRAVAVC